MRLLLAGLLSVVVFAASPTPKDCTACHFLLLADPAALASLLQEPDDDPGDLDAMDKLWAETAVTFGPSDVGCPKAEALVAAMKADPNAKAKRAQPAGVRS